jgi:hypothetical protein
MKRSSLFQLYRYPDAQITGWIVWAPAKKDLRISWPWFWGLVGLGFQLWPMHFYWFSEWQENHFEGGHVRVPPYPPRAPGNALEVYEYPERITGRG